MTLNHKELFLSPSGKIPYLLKGILPGAISSTNATSFETGAIAAPGFAVGITPAQTDWVMVAPMGDIGEQHTALNGARVTAPDQIALNFSNVGVGAPADETLNSGTPFPFLAFGIYPPEIIVEGVPPVQKSDFRKSPSGRLIMCYEKITVTNTVLVADTAAIKQIPSECAQLTLLPNNTYAADYVFAFPISQPVTGVLGATFIFNYACVTANGFIDLHFLSPPGGGTLAPASDWLFLLIKNKGDLGTVTAAQV